TCARPISTIDTATSVKFTINIRNVTSLSKNKLAKFRRNELGFIFQDYNLLDTLTIGENILLPLTLQKRKVKEMRKKLDHVTKQLDRKSDVQKIIYEVSGG